MNLFRRAAAPISQTEAQLGPLAELAGTWTGHGYNLIAVPDHQHNQIFRLIVNSTKEVLTFTPIGGPVPNRGSLQNDINIFGLTYLQQVSDAATDEGIHIEPGLWLNVPTTSDPDAPSTIVRQSTIPHGDSLLAQGLASCENRAPVIAPVSPLPTSVDGKPLPLGYTDPYLNGQFPPGFCMENPNQALVDVLNRQIDQRLEIVNTINLPVSSKPAGGIVNIPFITRNANATELDAIFWIETIQRQDGSQFMQLQYTQTVLLVFDEVIWPHISVATLIKR
ncbi:heme-binding protein [Chitinivorax sp. B]|uniref:heme-binding protein n=1 Tax=Chitinivorax sp. B TaxID=2502235 RepID=UPI0010F55399|nr:heme-binding protein [Chitinivorax sp. B]